MSKMATFITVYVIAVCRLLQITVYLIPAARTVEILRSGNKETGNLPKAKREN